MDPNSVWKSWKNTFGHRKREVVWRHRDNTSIDKPRREIWNWSFSHGPQKETTMLTIWNFQPSELGNNEFLLSKEIQPVHSEGDQPWDFFGRNDSKAETPVLCPPHVKSWLIGKDSNAGRDWGQEEKGTTEDEMAGWHHWLDGHESGWTPGVGDGQGGLACCNSWDHKESDKTEHWTELNWTEAT